MIICNEWNPPTNGYYSSTGEAGCWTIHPFFIKNKLVLKKYKGSRFCHHFQQPSSTFINFLVLHFQEKRLMANAMSTAEDRRLKGSIASWFTTLRAMGTTNWHLTTSKVANYHWKPRQKKTRSNQISQKILVILGRLFNIGLWIDKLCHFNWCSAV